MNLIVIEEEARLDDYRLTRMDIHLSSGVVEVEGVVKDVGKVIVGIEDWNRSGSSVEVVKTFEQVVEEVDELDFLYLDPLVSV